MVARLRRDDGDENLLDRHPDRQLRIHLFHELGVERLALDGVDLGRGVVDGLVDGLIVQTTVGTAASPWAAGRPQWARDDKTVDKTIDDAATEIDPVKRKAFYAEFVKEVNTELPVWMPIEQIFVTVITAKARNHSNTPRWGSTSWHDLWLSA